MPETTQEVEPQSNNTGIDALPETWQKEVKSLRDEAAANRVKAKELQSKLEQMADYEDLKADRLKQAEEQGKFKELYEELNTKLEGYKGIEEENKTFKSYFEGKLDELLEGVDETTADLIRSSNKSMADKVATAEKLSKVEGTSSSKGAARPGGNGGGSEAEYIKRLSSASTSAEKLNILNEARAASPELHSRLKAIMMGE